jgi:carbonic anhydrase/acetyltransferase-like protein (isoleucine patch superfamily)
MPIYSFDGMTPELPEEGHFWVAPGAVVIGRVRLKRDASVWFGAILRGDNDLIEIGERTNVQDGCALHVDPGYPLTIGDDCTIGHSVTLHGCTIGANTLIGMSATILNGTRVGRNCVIGAHAFLPENKVIPDNSVVMGSPGRVVKELDPSKIAGLTKTAQGYVERWQRYRSGLKLIAE